MILEILLAKISDEQAEPFRRLIEISLNQKLEQLDIHVTEVRTLSDLIRLAPGCNIIITGLHLMDAGPEEIIAALPALPEPVLVTTDIIDPEIHARCRQARAIVFDTNNSRYADICLAITGLLKVSIVQSLEP